MLVPFTTATENRFPHQSLTRNRTAWIYDVDDVLHNYEGAGDIYDFYAEVKILHFGKFFPDLTAIQIREIGLQSYKTLGDGILGYVAYGLSTGVIPPGEEKLFRERFFRDFHKEKFRLVSERNLPLLKPHDRTTQLMDRLNNAGITQSFLTQGCRIHWAEPVLEAKEVLRFFERSISMDFFDSNFETKKLSIHPIAEAIRRHGVSPDKVVFIEDSIDNLVTAKQYDPRILTVLISPRPIAPEKEAFVDIHAPDLVTFLEYAKDIYCPTDPRLTHERPDARTTLPAHPFPQRG